jgi:hypothetical protein
LNAAKSYRITDCTNGKEFVSVQATGYLRSGCGGIGIPYTLDNKIPAACQHDTILSCQANPIAITQKWPTVGAYLNDAKCGKAAGYISMIPDCYYLGTKFGDFSADVTCGKGALSVSFYNDTETCSGGVFDRTVVLPENKCVLVGDIPIPTPPKSVKANMDEEANLYDAFLGFPLNMDLAEVVLTGYVKSTCSGL